MMDGEGTSVALEPEILPNDVVADSGEGTVQPDAPDAGGGATADVVPPAESAPTDGRTLPKDVQAALKGLRDNPETSKVARALNDTYFREQAYQKTFATPGAAAAAKATLEMLGGDDGIAEMQGRIEQLRVMDEDLAAGKPESLDSLVKDSPEGFKKLIPAALDKLAKLDFKAYGATVAPIIANTLKNYQLPQVLQALQSSTDPNVKRAFEVLSQLNTDLENEIRNAPKQTEDNKAQGEWDKIYSEKLNMQTREVGGQVLRYQNEAIAKVLNPLLKTRALSEDAKSDLGAGVNSEIQKLLNADKSYQDKVGASIKKIGQLVKSNGDTTQVKKTLASFINAKMDEVAPKATRAVWNRRYGATPQQRTQPTNGNGPVRQGHLPSKPKVEELDKVVGWDTMYIAHKGYIKGKLVSW